MNRSGTFASGRHLRAARAAAGLEQKELAALAGLHRKSVQRIESMENIRGSVHAVKRIVEVLERHGVTVSRWPEPTVTIGKPVQPEQSEVSPEDDFGQHHAREPEAEPEKLEAVGADSSEVTPEAGACPSVAWMV